MNWRLFLVLWLAGIAAALVLVPVVVMATPAKPNLWLVTTLTLGLSAAAVYLCVIYIGLRMGGRLGFGAPIIAGWMAGSPPPDAARDLGVAAAIGLAAGVAGVLAALAISMFRGDVDGAASVEVLPLWAGLALSFHAAIDEELLFRFGIMTLIVWVVARILPAAEGPRPTDYGMWIAVGLSAVVFEATHVVAVSAAGEALIAATIPMQVVRFAVAVLLGWLYWTRGLESAMVTHFVYNMVIFYGIVLAL